MAAVLKQVPKPAPQPTGQAPQQPAPIAPGRSLEAVRAVVLRILAPMLGFAALLAVWIVVHKFSPDIPSPAVVFDAALKVFADPFYKAGPNDVGIGFKIGNSLLRVGMGFGLAAVVGIPFGFLIGRSKFVGAMFNPVITLLRPVSPLAWLPIGLLVFKGANPAAIWTIFICSIWPMIINTAVGVQRVPQDYLNVAKVLNLNEWKVITKILLPSVLPYILTGVRLAVGTAWLVIVAAEMLTGGVGVGFWVWDEWNNLNVANIIVAIFVIGIVGLILEVALVKLAQSFTYEDVKA
ncbi:nitrate ABC transporter permease [Derxia gummosa]|uniref:Nitrate ABC transporter permease n=1 Tax=Derxia gummosa DSM 723 TaxID=1121388 RepID=A0A8B6X635_9BURK|nr:nitrate ABC transporter permease [Derxia gummosa]